VSDDNRHQSPASLNYDAMQRRLRPTVTHTGYTVALPDTGSRTDGGVVVSYDATEQDVLLRVFSNLLFLVTKDGGKKREAGTKPPWWKDQSHMAAVWSHFAKHERGELVDEDSGAHPFVHAAWRLLAIAYQETYGKADPAWR